MQVGIFQCAGGGLNFEQRLARLARKIDDLSTGLDLVLCPELFASGYNVGEQCRALAEPVDGPLSERIGELAARLETAIVYGYPERGDGCLYNSAAFVSAEGRLLANHRKRLNSPGSFEQDYFTPGSRVTVVDYRGLRFALLICYEVEFPEAVRQVALAGAQVVLVPTALVAQWDVVASRVVPSRAFENGVWLAYANHAGHENGFDYLGGSKIVAPDGTIEADAGAGESLIFTRVDAGRVAAAQQRLPYLRDRKVYVPD